MKRFISFNIKSIAMYVFVVLIDIGIIAGSISSRNPMMFLFPFVGAWMLFAFFMALFSRCTYGKESIIIHGDFLIREKEKIQKKHIIKYEDILDYKNEFLPSGVDSHFNPIKIGYNTRNQYLSFYNYHKIQCITFYLKNGTKACLIINRYSNNQVEKMYDILNHKVNKSYYENIQYNKSTSQDEDTVSIEWFKYPKFMYVLFAMYFITFVAFAIHSGTLGGDALNGFERAGEYYVSSHGTDTLVTYQEWRTNYILGIAMTTSAILLFPTAIIYHIVNWFKERR